MRAAISAGIGGIDSRVTPVVGDHLLLNIGYSDQAVHLHENIIAARDGKVVAVWPTLARGKLT